ncbi:hypothetical protein HDE_08021 [Halotydeus destructor]|nr:hypothetical protein HDE_08021 [Halotydeus destructor]
MKQMLSPISSSRRIFSELSIDYLIVPHAEPKANMSSSPSRRLPFDIFNDSLINIVEEDEGERSEEILKTEDDDSTSDVMVDFVQMLTVERTLPGIFTQITNYLNSHEILKMSHVSKAWRKAVLVDSKANRRREQFLNERKELFENVGLENWPIKKKNLEKPLARSAFKTLSYQQKSEKDENGELRGQGDTSFNGSFISSAISSKAMSCPSKSYSSVLIQSRLQASQSKVLTGKKFKPKRLKIAEDDENTVNNPNLIAGSRSSKKNLKRL